MYNRYMGENCKDEHVIRSKINRLVQFPRKPEINEWRFCVLLFLVSLTIVVGKLVLLYGTVLPSFRDNLSSLSNVKSQFYHLYGISNASVFTTRFNDGQYVNETFIETRNRRRYKPMMELCDDYGWLIKAALSGLGILGITWFIIYKDSSIPGVNPPSPFSPSKKKFSDDSKIQMNYLIGVINGFLIFVYMCLE